ncbi:MAG: crossover junction endodeoxyribonuclease RuvC [Proteobacteria bacterium]|nr:crossover junction endodeoxyribonuclease RuvC [Pseudomonadota bacterium]
MMKQEKPRVAALGVDPGLAATGYAVIRTRAQGGEACAWGSLKTSSKLSLPQRLHIIYRGIESLIKEWNPVLLIMEDIYAVREFPKAAIQLGEVKGVISLAAQQQGVTVMRMNPTEVKNSITGHGRATKDQVRRAVKRVLRMQEDITPDHASDAAALAITGLSRHGHYRW